MKYATFKDFVRESYYHGVDYMELEINFKDTYTDTEATAWRHRLHNRISRKEFEDTDYALRVQCNSITIPGVCTYLPDEAAMNKAYQEAKSD
jgi:hypothetical protein